MMKLLIIVGILLGASNGSFIQVCNFAGGFGQGWRGTDTCQKDMFNTCHAVEEIMDDIVEIFENFEHAIFTVAANFYQLVMDLWDFWVSCSLGSFFEGFFGDLIGIIMDYPNRITLIKDHLSCLIQNFEQSEYQQVGVCLGQLFADLTEPIAV